MQFGPVPSYGGLQSRGTAPVFGAEGRGFTCLSEGTLRALDGASAETLWQLRFSSLGEPTNPTREGR